MAQKYDGGSRPGCVPDLVYGHPGRRIGFDPPQGQAFLPGDALHQVAVRGEVVRVQDDLCAGGVSNGGQRSTDQFVEHHRGGVGDDGLARGCAEDSAAQLIADGLGQVQPFLVPATDEPAAPAVLDEGADVVDCSFQRAAQGVAVEVGQIRVRPDKEVAAACQWVGGIQLRCPLKESGAVVIFQVPVHRAAH